MNNQSAFLLSVLSKCLPQDSELSYENKVQTIVRSKEYYDISRTPSFSTVFKDQFAQQKLRAYSDKELAGIVKALPLIPKVLDGIEKSLTSGVGPWLKEEDRPDFRNKTSLDNLLKKLQGHSGTNYCNIPSERSLEIFDGDVVNSIGTDFGKLPMDCKDFNAEIANLLKGKPYCISASEVLEREQEYEQKIGHCNDVIRSSKEKRWARRFRKALIGTVFLFVPSIVGGFTGLLSSDAISTCTVAELLLVLMFWIGG